MNRPVNRLELIDILCEQIRLAKEAGDELMFVEVWQIAWLIAPMKYDPEGTANIVIPDFEPGDDITKRHVPITVVNAEGYMKRLDCGAVTEEMEVDG